MRMGRISRMLVVHARSSSPARPVTGAQRGWEVAKRRISDDADGLRRLLDLLTEAGATAEAPIPVAVETAATPPRPRAAPVEDPQPAPAPTRPCGDPLDST